MLQNCFPLPQDRHWSFFFQRHGKGLFQIVLKLLHVFQDFLAGNFCIDLCSAYRTVPHHLADGFYRHAVIQTDQGSERVPGHIECEVAIQTTRLFYQFQGLAQTARDRHEEQFAVLAFPLVFLHDTQRDVKQFDMAVCPGLAAVEMQPFRAVRLRHDVLFRQAGKVRPSESGKA